MTAKTARRPIPRTNSWNKSPLVSLHFIRTSLVRASVGQSATTLLEHIDKDPALKATEHTATLAGSTFRTYNRHEANRFIAEFIQTKQAQRQSKATAKILSMPVLTPTAADPSRLERIEEKLDKLLALWDSK